jgi:hypothetical protein
LKAGECFVSIATKTENRVDVIRHLSETAGRVKDARVRVVSPAISPGDNARQGDLYFTLLGEELPDIMRAWEGRQLAPGNSQGSRHFAVGDCEIHAVDEGKALVVLSNLDAHFNDKLQFIGPLVKAPNGFLATHGTMDGSPAVVEGELDESHGTLKFPPGNYLVTYQRSLGETIQRTQD